MARGKFIVVEGADGVGSTTQANRLVEGLRLAGRTVHQTSEPSSGPIGVLIRQMLGGERPRTQIHRELALLFAADRLDHVAREVEPQLAAGVDVVSDRYTMSSLVYQSLDLPFDWVRELNRNAPPADVTVLIALPLEKAWERLEARLQTGAVREVFDVKPPRPVSTPSTSGRRKRATRSSSRRRWHRRRRRACQRRPAGTGTWPRA